MLAKMSKIYKNVSLGKNTKIGDFVIIGHSSNNLKNQAQKTVIGANSAIRSHTVIYAGNRIGKNFQTGHAAFIRENNKIGNNVSIGTKTVIEHDVIIGNNVRIHSNAFIPEFSVLKDNCWIGPNVVLTNSKYPMSKGSKENLEGPIIGKNAKIGANSTILPGVNIGENSVIGAGSVVTKDIPKNKVAYGNPAKVVKDLNELKDAKSNGKPYD